MEETRMCAMTATRIDEALQQAVDRGVLPHVVATAADHHGPIYEGSFGPRVAGRPDSVDADTLFRISSMTKLVTTVAALQQVELDELHLDDPVERYRPEFGALEVLDGFDPDGTPRLRPPKTKATVRQLITHTSGLAYWFWNADIARWERETGAPNTLAGTRRALSAPLVTDPGTRFEYGTSTDWLGRVVEAVSGQPLDDYFAEHIFEPLGMEDTTFAPTPEQRTRLAALHKRTDEGWKATSVDWVREPEYWSGGHGLYSTPRDYLRFQRMLLEHGELDGAHILDHDTVDAAFTNQIGPLSFPARIASADPQTSVDYELGRGLKWGLGLLINEEEIPGRRAACSGSWGGIQNTYFWVDHRTGVTGAFYTQVLPFGAPEVRAAYEDFERAVYDAMRG
jgi:methyl acetate hydrolase